jgi:hypothetical protein
MNKVWAYLDGPVCIVNEIYLLENSSIYTRISWPARSISDAISVLSGCIRALAKIR